MWMNLDTLPAGKSMFTVYVTLDPEGTPRNETTVEEIDVIAPRHCSSWGQININENQVHPTGEDAGEYMQETYGLDVRVVGVVNVSEDYVVFDAWKAGADE